MKSQNMLSIIHRWRSWSRPKRPFCSRVNFLSYPKTGSTWARLLLGSYFQMSTGASFEFLLEGYEEENGILNKFGIPAFYSTHAPLTWETQTEEDLTYDNVVKPYFDDFLILMVRYPLDAILSSYMQQHHERVHEQLKKFNSFLDFVEDPVFGVEKAVKFYNIWSQVLESSNIFALKYEDLRAHTFETMSSLLNFLRIAPQVQSLREAIDHRSFDNMKKLEASGNAPRYRTSGLKIFTTGDPDNPNAFFVREGKCRGYRNYLDHADCARFERFVRERLSRKYGYE